MKAVKLKHFKEKKKDYSTIGEHYGAKCPFCSKNNTFWNIELNSKIDGCNKCAHFSGVKDKNVIFREDFDILIDPESNSVYINGILFGLHGLKYLLYYLEEIKEDRLEYSNELIKLYYYQSEYGSNGRLELLINYLRNKPVIKYVENYSI